MRNSDRAIKSTRWLQVAIITLVICGQLKQGSHAAQFDDLQRNLATAVGGRFDVVAGKAVFDSVGRPYWLASVRAKIAGDFLLRCHIVYQYPPGISFPHDDDATIEYRLVIGETGDSRTLSHGLYGTSTYPLACVGDTLLVPIPAHASETRHRFEMPEKLEQKEVDRFRGMSEIKKRPRPSQSRADGFEFLGNEFKDVLSPVAVEVRTIRSRAKNGPITYSYRSVFDVLAPGKRLLEISLDAPGQAEPQRQAIEILSREQHLTVPVSSWDIQRRSTFDGRKVTSSQTETASRVPSKSIVLRVGDQLNLSCGQYSTRLFDQLKKPPRVVLQMKPFQAPEETFRETPPQP